MVHELTLLPDDTAIVEAIIAMAHSLKLEVVAEGVETAGQLDFCAPRDATRFKDFYIGKPLSLTGATALIEGFAQNRPSE